LFQWKTALSYAVAFPAIFGLIKIIDFLSGPGSQDGKFEI
jgi:hypothetical protein